MPCESWYPAFVPPRAPAKAWRTVVACSLAWLALVVPIEARSPAADSATIAVEELPGDARKTLKLIVSGGPFPYARDGIAFGNYEKLLPQRARGYYHEYTVPTPGVKSRGARRIICGGAKASIAECYYSNDHYQSFRRILQ